MWCVYQKGKALASLDKEDIHEYLDFLKDPQPRHIWCGKFGVVQRDSKSSSNWRPFTDKTSISSLRLSIGILKSLFTYLVDAIYLATNPFKLIKKHDIGKFDQSIIMTLKSIAP